MEFSIFVPNKGAARIMDGRETVAYLDLQTHTVKRLPVNSPRLTRLLQDLPEILPRSERDQDYLLSLVEQASEADSPELKQLEPPANVAGILLKEGQFTGTTSRLTIVRYQAAQMLYQDMQHDLQATIERVIAEYERGGLDLEAVFDLSEVYHGDPEALQAIDQLHTSLSQAIDEVMNKQKQAISTCHRELYQLQQLAIVTEPVTTSRCGSDWAAYLSLRQWVEVQLSLLEALDKVVQQSDQLRADETLVSKVMNHAREVRAFLQTFQNKLTDISNHPHSYLLKEDRVSDIPPGSSLCSRLHRLELHRETQGALMTKMHTQLLDLLQDVMATTRVFVKLRNTCVNSGIQIDKFAKTVTRSNGKPLRFYGVMDATENNLQSFTGIHEVQADLSQPLVVAERYLAHATSNSSIFASMRQLETGYRVFISGYGTSGSGKTRLLFGDHAEPGLLQYTIANLRGITGVRLSAAFEHYVDKIDVTLGKVTSKIVTLHNTSNTPIIPDLSAYASDSEMAEFQRDTEPSRDVQQPGILQDLLTRITDYRTRQGRIRATPLNPQSSRSHLFLIFTVEFTQGSQADMIWMDCAGQENVNVLYGKYIKQATRALPLTSILGPSVKPQQLSSYMALDEKGQPYDAATVQQTLRESIWINESLLHYAWFMQSKTILDSSLYPIYRKQATIMDKYSPKAVYAQPSGEMQAWKNKEYNKKQKPKTAVLTVPILEHFSRGVRKVKLLTVACVRCDVGPEAVDSTLDFAHSFGEVQ